MIAYKVLRPLGKGLYSSNLSLPYTFTKCYRKGVVNRPLKGSKLFVFKSLDSARRYACNSSSCEIWEVDVPDRFETVAYLESSYYIEHFTRFWATAERKTVLSLRTPRGTLLVDGVKLIKKL